MWIWRKWQIRSCVGVISMIFDFNPWQLDVDIDLTKQLYKEVDYSTDKTYNFWTFRYIPVSCIFPQALEYPKCPYGR